jgi:heat shock protein HslJ
MRSKFVLSILFALLFTGLCQAKGAKTLLVADRTVPCAGTFECIQVREKTKLPWRNYSDTIEGFNYQEGYEYKLSVQPLQTKNTMSGLFEEKYKLLKVISKKKTTYNPIEKLADRKWIVVSMDDTKRTMSFGDTSGIFIVFDLKTGKASGKGICNTFNTSFSGDASKISFTDFGSTKMMCKGQTFEGVIFNFIKKTTTYKLQGNMLTLWQPDGSNMMLEGK